MLVGHLNHGKRLHENLVTEIDHDRIATELNKRRPVIHMKHVYENIKHDKCKQTYRCVNQYKAQRPELFVYRYPSIVPAKSTQSERNRTPYDSIAKQSNNSLRRILVVNKNVASDDAQVGEHNAGQTAQNAFWIVGQFDFVEILEYSIGVDMFGAENDSVDEAG